MSETTIENYMRTDPLNKVVPHGASGLKQLIATLPNNLEMVEIGCYAGESTGMWLRSGKVKSLVAVDPYFENYAPDDPGSARFKMSDVKAVFQRDIIEVFKNVEWLSMNSVEAAKVLEDRKFDFVYIDANHTYESIKQDINVWLPLIKSDGIIAGHDYHPKLFPGVVRAVNETFIKPDLVFDDTSWIKYFKIPSTLLE